MEEASEKRRRKSSVILHGRTLYMSPESLWLSEIAGW